MLGDPFLYALLILPQWRIPYLSNYSKSISSDVRLITFSCNSLFRRLMSSTDLHICINLFTLLSILSEHSADVFQFRIRSQIPNNYSCSPNDEMLRESFVFRSLWNNERQSSRLTATEEDFFLELAMAFGINFLAIRKIAFHYNEEEEEEEEECRTVMR